MWLPLTTPTAWYIRTQMMDDVMNMTSFDHEVTNNHVHWAESDV